MELDARLCKSRVGDIVAISKRSDFSGVFTKADLHTLY